MDNISKTIILALIVLMIVVFACQPGKSKKQQNGSVEDIENTPIETRIPYLYLDKAKCAHTQLNCPSYQMELYLIEDNERPFAPSGFSYSVHRIPIDSVKAEDIFYCCSSCINDSIYREIFSKASYSNKINNAPPSRRKEMDLEIYRAPEEQ